jgi:hypothetical protein
MTTILIRSIALFEADPEGVPEAPPGIVNTHRAMAVPQRGAPSPAARAARINATEKWIAGG